VGERAGEPDSVLAATIRSGTATALGHSTRTTERGFAGAAATRAGPVGARLHHRLAALYQPVQRGASDGAGSAEGAGQVTRGGHQHGVHEAAPGPAPPPPPRIARPHLPSRPTAWRTTDVGLAAGQGILTWRALTSSSSKPCSSSTYQTGLQYWPVASITTRVTSLRTSQSASAWEPRGNVRNVRTSWPRLPCPSGTRTQADEDPRGGRLSSCRTTPFATCRWRG
jgi:hypothetical protein